MPYLACLIKKSQKKLRKVNSKKLNKKSSYSTLHCNGSYERQFLSTRTLYGLLGGYSALNLSHEIKYMIDSFFWGGV